MAERLRELERSRAARFERALFVLLARLHRDGTCGKDGQHWVECEALFTQLGWSGYESYAADMEKLYVGNGTRVARRERALAAGSANDR